MPTFPDKDFTITDFGAIPDGHTLNTEAFRKAIRPAPPRAAAASSSPPENGLHGPIELLSHVNLYLAADAIVQFTGDHTQYPMIVDRMAARRHLTDLRRRR